MPQFFGKFKWGQDKTFVFVTVYCPGLDTSDIGKSLRVENEQFHFEAMDPKKGEIAKAINSC